MQDIALGFSNTVDYELEWNAAYLEKLIDQTGLNASDLMCRHEIRNMKDLLSSMLYHIREGTGCGMMIQNSEIVEEFAAGMRYRVTLGGTNIRAAEVIAKLGGSSFVHLVSVNPQTIKYMPKGTKWVGGEHFQSCYPHIALQYPAGAHIVARDIDIIAPCANRLLYSGDVACAQMKLSETFFTNLSRSKILVMAGFDMVPDRDTITKRIQTLTEFLDHLAEPRPVIFYEDGYFTDMEQWKIVHSMLGERIDLYSMNEDELQLFCGLKIDLLNPMAVLDALRIAKKQMPWPTLVVHTRHYVLAYGTRAKQICRCMEYGMSVASTRYLYGDVTMELMDMLANFPLQTEAVRFAGMIESTDENICCLPAREIANNHVTTVGLGDSFVGGFALAYSRGL